MLNIDEAKIIACNAIAQLFGFESIGNNWMVFAKVNINMETREVTFQDYKIPNGKRMEKPINPISFTEE